MPGFGATIWFFPCLQLRAIILRSDGSGSDARTPNGSEPPAGILTFAR